MIPSILSEALASGLSTRGSDSGHIQMDLDPRFSNSFEDSSRYEALLQTADLMVEHRDIAGLFRDLAERLQKVTECDVASFSLHDPAKNVMRVHMWEQSQIASPADEVPLEESLSGWVWQNQEPIIVHDQAVDVPFFPQAMRWLEKKGLRSYCTLPLTTRQRRLGALGMGSKREGAYGEKDLQLLRRVAELVALALENALTRAALEQEKRRLQMLLEISLTLASSLEFRRLFPAISECIGKVIRHDFAHVSFYDEPSNSLRVYSLDSPLSHGAAEDGTLVPIDQVPCGVTFKQGEAGIFDQEKLVAVNSKFVNRLLEEGIRSVCSLPLETQKGAIGTLSLASHEPDAFSASDMDLLKQVACQVAIALDNARAYREIAALTEKLKKEKLYLQDEIRSERNFEEIIGESAALKRVLRQTKTVAPSDATVLVLGETGTGKELIERAVHRMSSRKDNSFIKLNCAAIPTGLLESELFGHEKGAFTGAISQKIGRLELADKGTLFLDEVGDIPLDLQPKLLRVLQDQEFERLGGNRTIKVNTRLVAATNRDLAKSVAEREFRSDLFYRLNVFPICMPPLRERESDVPLLVRYFVQKYSRRMNKQIETIPVETMVALSSWKWPGNVRELENFLERSVILSDGPVLNVPLAELRIGDYNGQEGDGTLETLEREQIIRTLRDTRGVIAGLHGAAVRLGLKRTTLQSRMIKLGISRDNYVD